MLVQPGASPAELVSSSVPGVGWGRVGSAGGRSARAARRNGRRGAGAALVGARWCRCTTRCAWRGRWSRSREAVRRCRCRLTARSASGDQTEKALWGGRHHRGKSTREWCRRMRVGAAGVNTRPPNRRVLSSPRVSAAAVQLDDVAIGRGAQAWTDEIKFSDPNDTGENGVRRETPPDEAREAVTERKCTTRTVRQTCRRYRERAGGPTDAGQLWRRAAGSATSRSGALRHPPGRGP